MFKHFIAGIISVCKINKDENVSLYENENRLHASPYLLNINRKFWIFGMDYLFFVVTFEHVEKLKPLLWRISGNLQAFGISSQVLELIKPAPMKSRPGVVEKKNKNERKVVMASSLFEILLHDTNLYSLKYLAVI